MSLPLWCKSSFTLSVCLILCLLWLLVPGTDVNAFARNLQLPLFWMSEPLIHYSLHVDSVNTDLYTLIQSVNVEVIGMVVAINSRRTCTWFFVRLIWYVCATARRHQRMQQAAASCWRISATTRYQTYSCLISLITLWSSLKINMDLGLCLFVCEFLLLAFLYLHQWSYMKQKFAET